MGLESDLTASEQPRIYVACLAAYNNGVLHGAWIDVHQDAAAIYKEIFRVLRSSPIPDAEEWAIHDYEGFQGVPIAEYADIERVVEMAGFIAEHGRLGAELVALYGEVKKARHVAENRYMGVFLDLADYMQNMNEECLTIPEPLRLYIDWKAMARDAELNGDVFTIQTAHDETHVFAGR